MRKDYEFIEDANIGAIYIQELNTLVVNTNPESKNGVIYYFPQGMTAREGMRLVK